MTITERMAAWRRQRRVLRRVSRAAWRLEQAEAERSWALVSARAEGISIRTLAEAAGLSPARVHQITTGANLDELDAMLGELRAAGWPAPEDPEGDDDAEHVHHLDQVRQVQPEKCGPTCYPCAPCPPCHPSCSPTG